MSTELTNEPAKQDVVLEGDQLIITPQDLLRLALMPEVFPYAIAETIRITFQQAARVYHRYIIDGTAIQTNREGQHATWDPSLREEILLRSVEQMPEDAARIVQEALVYHKTLLSRAHATRRYTIEASQKWIQETYARVTKKHVLLDEPPSQSVSL